MVNTNLDTTPLPEPTYTKEEGFAIAGWIRTKRYGKHVREAIARFVEWLSLRTEEIETYATGVVQTSKDIQSRFENLVIGNTQFKNEIISEKNAVIANATQDSEVILARGGKATLGARLDETTAQLAQTAIDINERGFNVKMNGVVGDGIVDDTLALQALFNSTNIGDSVILPKGKYRTTTTLIIEKEIAIMGDQAEIFCDHDVTGIKVKRPDGILGTSKINQVKINVSITRKNRSQNLLSIGLEVVDTFRGVFNVPKLENHGIALLLTGDKSGTTYNQFYLGFISDCFIGIKTKAVNNGYVTENTFYGGHFGSGLITNPEQTHSHVWIDNTTEKVQNNNKFYNCSFEGYHKNGVIIEQGQSNNFIGCRFEMPKAEFYIKLVNASTTQGNTFLDCYGLAGGLKNGKILDGGVRTRISGSQFPIGAFEYTDKNVYVFASPGAGKQNDFNPGLNVTNLGWRSTQRLTITTDTIIIDFSKSDHFDITFTSGADVANIQFVNLPPTGTLATISFLQSQTGNSINGLPALFFGRNTNAPVKRAHGRDIYQVTRGSSSMQEVYALSQYKS